MEVSELPDSNGRRIPLADGHLGVHGYFLLDREPITWTINAVTAEVDFGPLTGSENPITTRTASR